MPEGPGKYDELCTEAREKAKSIGAVLMIFDGEKGWGFSVQMPPRFMAQLPALLRDMANKVEHDLPRDLKNYIESN